MEFGLPKLDLQERRGDHAHKVLVVPFTALSGVWSRFENFDSRKIHNHKAAG
jgi:hypothetical protein